MAQTVKVPPGAVNALRAQRAKTSTSLLSNHRNGGGRHSRSRSPHVSNNETERTTKPSNPSGGRLAEPRGTRSAVKQLARMTLGLLSNCLTNSSHNYFDRSYTPFGDAGTLTVWPQTPRGAWARQPARARTPARPCTQPPPIHAPRGPRAGPKAPLQNPPGQTLSTNSSQTDSDRLEFSLMFAGTTFWKPPNARQAQHRDQTKTSGHTSQRAPARLGLQVGSAPKLDGGQKQGWCSNGAFQKPKHKPEVKF